MIVEIDAIDEQKITNRRLSRLLIDAGSVITARGSVCQLSSTLSSLDSVVMAQVSRVTDVTNDRKAQLLITIHNHHFSTLAAAAHLSKKGLRVLGIDRHPRIHANGSSHGRSRIIRLAYYEDHRCEFACLFSLQ